VYCKIWQSGAWVLEVRVSQDEREDREGQIRCHLPPSYKVAIWSTHRYGPPCMPSLVPSTLRSSLSVVRLEWQIKKSESGWMSVRIESVHNQYTIMTMPAG